MTRIGFAVSGRGRLAMTTIRNGSRLGVEPAHVILDTTADADIDGLLESHSVPFTRLVPGEREEIQNQILRVITSFDDVHWMLTFDRILNASIVEARPHGISNYHPALLPAHRGTKPIRKALESGARFTGATIHQIDAGVDTGPIVAQTVVPIHPGDDEMSLGKRVFDAGLPLFMQVAAWYADGRVEWMADGKIWVRGGTFDGGAWAPALEATVTSIVAEHNPA